MVKKDPLDAYELSYQEFYSEIPGSLDYLNDIDPEIQDEHDAPDSVSGLSDEQVSQIARDSLAGSHPTGSDSSAELFPDNPGQATSQDSIF